LSLCYFFLLFAGCRLQDDPDADGDVPQLPQLRRCQAKSQGRGRHKNDVIVIGRHHVAQEVGQPPRSGVNVIKLFFFVKDALGIYDPRQVLVA
jgi:hypothetical protein